MKIEKTFPHLSPVVSLVLLVVHLAAPVEHLWGHVRLGADDAVAHHARSPRGREPEISDLQHAHAHAHTHTENGHVGGWARGAERNATEEYAEFIGCGFALVSATA